MATDKTSLVTKLCAVMDDDYWNYLHRLHYKRYAGGRLSLRYYISFETFKAQWSAYSKLTAQIGIAYDH